MGEVFDRGDQEAEEDALSFSFTQLEGEAVFVPSGWQHKVRNIEETLSVNHNWFTAASIDRIWECILIEAKSVEDECNQWGIPSDDLDARETMLRGCIGLNVSMFFLALLFSLVQVGTEARRQSNQIMVRPRREEHGAFHFHCLQSR